MLDHLRQHYYDQPHEVSIETLAQCNARCTFCPYGTLGREGTRLPDAVLERLIQEMGRWRLPFFVSPFKVSDPLLDPRMEWLCHEIELKVPQAKIRFFTNGSMLTERHLEWLAKLKHLSGLWISLNSCDAIEYERLMGLKYATTARRMGVLHTWMRDGRFPHKVTVSRVMSGTAADDVTFRDTVRSTWPCFEPFLIKRDGWLGAVLPSSLEIPRRACERWYELSIDATGTAALCCMDGKSEFALGRVPEQTLLEIYNQPHLKARRLSVLTREGIEPCARCTY